MIPDNDAPAWFHPGGNQMRLVTGAVAPMFLIINNVAAGIMLQPNIQRTRWINCSIRAKPTWWQNLLRRPADERFGNVAMSTEEVLAAFCFGPLATAHAEESPDGVDFVLQGKFRRRNRYLNIIFCDHAGDAHEVSVYLSQELSSGVREFAAHYYAQQDQVKMALVLSEAIIAGHMAKKRSGNQTD